MKIKPFLMNIKPFLMNIKPFLMNIKTFFFLVSLLFLSSCSFVEEQPEEVKKPEDPVRIIRKSFNSLYKEAASDLETLDLKHFANLISKHLNEVIDFNKILELIIGLEKYEGVKTLYESSKTPSMEIFEERLEYCFAKLFSTDYQIIPLLSNFVPGFQETEDNLKTSIKKHSELKILLLHPRDIEVPSHAENDSLLYQVLPVAKTNDKTPYEDDAILIIRNTEDGWKIYDAIFRDFKSDESVQITNMVTLVKKMIVKADEIIPGEQDAVSFTVNFLTGTRVFPFILPVCHSD